MAKTDSVDKYIASQPRAVQVALKRVRSTIRKAVPGAEEVISYKIPAYKLPGGRLIYFAGWSEHYSLYPAGDRVVAAFKDDLAPYKVSKGTIRFPLSEPVPVKLIERIAKFRAKEVTIMKKSGSQGVKSPSRLIDARIEELGDWRGEMLSRLRTLIKQADPEVVEEWKWRGTPVWSHNGLVCTGETYKNVVKVTFAKGASLEDPSRLFNSSLEGNTRRAIDFRDGDKINEKALKALIRAAVSLNTSSNRSRLKR